MYYFDSYALFEILEGNPAYDGYLGSEIITSALNIGEFYYGLLKQTTAQRAESIADSVKPDLLEIDVATVKKAMAFRHAHIKSKFSTVDCVGYVLARSHGLKFLTGDKEFEGMPGVEFVN